MMKSCVRCGRMKEMQSWERICWQCTKKENLERAQQAIRESGPDEQVDTGSTDYVICPYCGEALHTNVGPEDFPEIYEAGRHKLECPECGKTFALETYVSYMWETEKIFEGGD